MMKSIVIIFSLLLFTFFSCKSANEDKEDLNTSDSFITNNQDLILKDSVTYYNSQQKTLNINYTDYFGFMFDADDQDLEWKLDPSINQNVFYVSEVYEPNLNVEELPLKGKQFFTFQALKKGKANLKFLSSKTNEFRTVEVIIN